MSTILLFITIAAWVGLVLSLTRAFFTLKQAVSPGTQCSPFIQAMYVSAVMRALVLALICGIWIVARWLA